MIFLQCFIKFDQGISEKSNRPNVMNFNTQNNRPNVMNFNTQNNRPNVMNFTTQNNRPNVIPKEISYVGKYTTLNKKK